MPSQEEKILNAASQILLEKGPAGLSLRVIAKMAGVSTMGIYSYFNGKQGLLDALYIQGFGHVYDAMEAASKMENPRQAAIAGTQGYIDMARQYQAEYRLIFGGSGADYSPGEDARKAEARAFGRLVDIAAKLLPETASLSEKQKMALKIWALVHGYVSIYLHGVNDVLQFDDWDAQILSSMSQLVDATLKI
ncbi:hypothetical protein LPB140_09950 [Sphingorhabdus lutea]|uniref:HTH tetR-type domain-containing protein n=1 Tax=Sphingorhabdus lutea TaxID=1913578 RepID=A0A1L3JD47_9SPHN|nr:TetR/AcrR family transcriptional regulator [Sphingorhabdus lutea]APG63055.1 hypothetical protein LPB140_09950 [Sphingorhabdus lutea]